MKLKRAFLLLLALGLPLSGWAQQSSRSPLSNANDVATTWPEVHYQVFHIERIAGDRLVLGVRIYATSSAPLAGTFIGVIVPVPKYATPEMIGSGMYRPRAVSIKSAVLTDDATQHQYQTVAPDPAGPNYFPPEVLATLHPLEARSMAIVFPCPPPPPIESGITPDKQTISLSLPNAKGPIMRMTLPPVGQPMNMP